MDLSDFIMSRETVLLDGAMGTELEKLGREMGGQNNLFHPEAVLDIHRRYAESGCRILTANTLTMNRIFIESHGLGVEPAEVNAAGIRLARQAVGKDGCVLGDLSATGKLLEPYGECSEHELYQTYKEQAGFLADAGADGFLVETVLDLREALCALRGCLDAADLPVMVSMSFATAEKEGRTIMGNAAGDCARELTQAGACAVGANCGDLDPTQTAKVVSLLRAATSLPVLAQPNAGKPRLVGGRTVFDMPPGEFARGIGECLRAGAKLVGGCCGTSPAHIKAAAAVLQGYEKGTADAES